MQYKFGKGNIIYPTGTKREYPYVDIEKDTKYGDFFNSEITHLGSNLDYVKEIVSKLEAILNGSVDFYEGFGYEVYMIECDIKNARVVNIFESDRLEAIIPTIEVYEIMRDWRNYLIEYNKDRL